MLYRDIMPGNKAMAGIVSAKQRWLTGYLSGPFGSTRRTYRYLELFEVTSPSGSR